MLGRNPAALPLGQRGSQPIYDPTLAPGCEAADHELPWVIDRLGSGRSPACGPRGPTPADARMEGALRGLTGWMFSVAAVPQAEHGGGQPRMRLRTRPRWPRGSAAVPRHSTGQPTTHQRSWRKRAVDVRTCARPAECTAGKGPRTTSCERSPQASDGRMTARDGRHHPHGWGFSAGGGLRAERPTSKKSVRLQRRADEQDAKRVP